MKLTLQTEGKRLTVDMEKAHCESLFNRLSLQMLGLNHLSTKKLEIDQSQERPKEKAYEPIDDEKLHKYKGFFYLKCPDCGNIKAFCYKKDMKGFHCFECGADVPFTDELRRLWVNCQCGRRFRYWTNQTEEIFDVNCPDCGNPVAVSWNEKKGVYQTIVS